MSDFKWTERESQSLLVAEALWLVQKRLRMGKVDWRAQVLIPILYMLSNTLTINLASPTSPKALTPHLLWHLKPKASTDHLRDDLDLGISCRSMGISLCFKEVIVVILGQVGVVLVMGIPPRSLGISLGFKGRCKRYLLMGISPESLGIFPVFQEAFGTSQTFQRLI